ncbi:hypothetical protein OAG94_02070, partial [bacterium]|nr:hypothetical protein [bacterium]
MRAIFALLTAVFVLGIGARADNGLVTLNADGTTVQWAHTTGVNGSGMQYDLAQPIGLKAPAGYTVVLRNTGQNEEYDTGLELVSDVHDLLVSTGNINTAGYGGMFYMYNSHVWDYWPTTYVAYAKSLPDTTPPIITLPGETLIATQGVAVDLLNGVTATDNVDGNISANIAVTICKSFTYSFSQVHQWNPLADFKEVMPQGLLDIGFPAVASSLDGWTMTIISVGSTRNGSTPSDPADWAARTFTLSALENGGSGQPTALRSSAADPVWAGGSVQIMPSSNTVLYNVLVRFDYPMGGVTNPNTYQSSTTGDYTLKYNVSDAAGNVATPATRTVTVQAPTTYSVTNTLDDESTGSFRSAIISANASSTINSIVFDAGVSGTITLTSDLPGITNDLTITGPGESVLAISGDNTYAMFSVSSGKTLTLSGLTFTENKSGNGSIIYLNSAYAVATSIKVTANTNSIAFYSNSNSTLTISSSTFSNNSGTIFGSDHGNTPSNTSDTETDYTNRITVTDSDFSSNSGDIFYTERYVKVDNCTFVGNSGYIGTFRGLNRYQVLNSTFTNNTGSPLFTFSNYNLGTSWGDNLGANHHLFDGNTFSGNTGTVINVVYGNKTTIINNTFQGNGVNWTGTPADTTGNTVVPINEAPTGLALSNAGVAENEAVGTVVGTFSTTDADTGDTHTYTLVSGTDDTNNGSFKITVSSLETTATFNYEAQSSQMIRVKTDDGNGGTFEQAFTITIADDTSDNGAAAGSYLLVNTVNPTKDYDTMMVGYKDATSTSLKNDDIDNDADDFGTPQVFGTYEDANYQSQYHFEMSALDVNVNDVPDGGYFRVIVTEYGEGLDTIPYDQVQGDRPTTTYLDGLQLNIGVIAVGQTTTQLDVDPAGLTHQIELAADQIRDYTIVDIKLNSNKTAVSEIRVNESNWITTEQLAAAAAQLGWLTWTTTNGEVTITDCETAATGELVIPDTIEG